MRNTQVLTAVGLGLFDSFYYIKVGFLWIRPAVVVQDVIYGANGFTHHDIPDTRTYRTFDDALDVMRSEILRNIGIAA